MTDKVEQIRQEIERRYNINRIGAHSAFRNGKCEALREVLDFIGSMPDKPKFKVGDTIRYRWAEKGDDWNKGTIIGIEDGKYLMKDGYVDIEHQDQWELVEEPKDKCNGCNNVKGCVTCVDGSEWAHYEESVSGLNNDDMPIERWKQAVAAASNQRNYRSSKGLTETRDDYFVDGVQWADKHPKEEPVSEELEDEYNNYIDIHDGEWTKDDYLAFARHFANWGSKHHKPIGEDFEKVVSDFLDQYTYPREEVDFLQFALYINSWAREQISKHYYLNTQDLDIAAEKCEESWVKVGIEPQKKGDYVSIFKAGAKWGKNQAMAEIQAQSMALAHGCPKENTSNELKVAADNALESISDKYDIISVGSCLEMFRLGANWQKQQMMEDAVDGRFSYNPNFKENEFICLEKSDTPEHYLGELVKVIIIKQKEE